MWKFVTKKRAPDDIVLCLPDPAKATSKETQTFKYTRFFEIRRTERAEDHKDRQYCQVCRSGCPTNFCLCILFCTKNRKCNWYAGTITVNLELDSASNDIYFLNMQLFPW